MAESRGTAITVAVIGAVATIVAALIGVVLMRPGGDGGSPPAQPQVPGVTIAPNPAPDGGRPSVFLSRDSGPAGTLVRVSGEGFAKGERVVLRFHTEQIGSTTADGQGKFSNVAVTVPSSFARFAPQQFSVVATGQSSIRSGGAPFTITG